MIDKLPCTMCKKPKKESSLTRLSYRFKDKNKRYKGSNYLFIHTGYLYLCSKDLLKLTKFK